MKRTFKFVVLIAVIGSISCTGIRPPAQPLLGLWHEVEGDETAASIASQYGASNEVIVALNDLPRDGSVLGREEVFVPKKGGTHPGTGAPPPEPLGPEPTVGNSTAKTPTILGRCKSDCVAWPADGEVGSVFGKRGGAHHDGLDIKGGKGSPIKAADDGKVLYSGDSIKGYGNLVIISHGEGIITVYAHNDENLVIEGDVVKKRDTIAKMGNSGTASTVHLHFEIRVNEQPTDPLDFLPKSQ